MSSLSVIRLAQTRVRAFARDITSQMAAPGSDLNPFEPGA
jgi:hypothetical protein